MNKVTANYRVTEELWAVLQPLLPKPVNSHQGVWMDKGDAYTEVRDTLTEFGFTAHIRGSLLGVWLSAEGDCRISGGALCYSESEAEGFGEGEGEKWMIARPDPLFPS